jgi:nuclear mRNA export protein PCID2/THP1
MFNDSLFKWFENNKREGFQFHMFPKSWQVNVAFYKGRYLMYNNEHVQAREQLKLAFALCNNKFMKNKQRILRYLIPCEMLKGNFPSP